MDRRIEDVNKPVNNDSNLIIWFKYQKLHISAQVFRSLFVFGVFFFKYKKMYQTKIETFHPEACQDLLSFLFPMLLSPLRKYMRTCLLWCSKWSFYFASHVSEILLSLQRKNRDEGKHIGMKRTSCPAQIRHTWHNKRSLYTIIQTLDDTHVCAEP